MASDILRLVLVSIKFGLPLILKILYQKVIAIFHRRSYKPVPSAKNVVVLGGSFAGVELVKRLCESLPTGYRVVLIEQNSHFNYTFNFPRFSVLTGQEHFAFIPYDGISKQGPEGIFSLIHGEAKSITETTVQLTSGEEIEFAYLAIATGTSSPPPTKVASRNRDDACAELQILQNQIATSTKIAVVGGGAVGVEIAADIKSFYPCAQVTLFHSRHQLLSSFGPRLHDHVHKAFEEMGIRTVLGERPQSSSRSLTFSDGRVEDFDSVIPCTGQTPNTQVLSLLMPHAVSKNTARILVRPTLQLEHVNDDYPNLFALGDVAETGGPKMARATMAQAEVVALNILDAIHGKLLSRTYKPALEFEGAIKLTLGKEKSVIYCMNDQGREILVPIQGGKNELDIAQGWRMLGLDIKTAQLPISSATTG